MAYRMLDTSPQLRFFHESDPLETAETGKEKQLRLFNEYRAKQRERDAWWLFPSKEELAVQRRQELEAFEAATPQFIPLYLLEGMEELDQGKKDLMQVLEEFLQGYSAKEAYSLPIMVSIIRHYLTEMHATMLKFKIPLRKTPGCEIASSVRDHKKNVIHIIGEYERMLKTANDEVLMHKMQIENLEAALSGQGAKLEFYEKSLNESFTEEELTNAEFISDLQSRVAAGTAMCSSLQQEVSVQQEQNSLLQDQVMYLTEQSLSLEEQCILDLARYEPSAHLNELMRQSLHETLAGYDVQMPANMEDAHRAVTAWEEKIRQAGIEREAELEDLTRRLKEVDEKVSSLRGAYEEAETYAKECDRKIVLASKFNGDLKMQLDALVKEEDNLVHQIIDYKNNTERLKDKLPQVKDEYNTINSLHIKYLMETNRLRDEARDYKEQVRTHLRAIEAHKRHFAMCLEEERQLKHLIASKKKTFKSQATSPMTFEEHSVPKDLDFWEMDSTSHRESSRLFPDSSYSLQLPDSSRIAFSPIPTSPPAFPDDSYRRGENIDRIISRKYPTHLYGAFLPDGTPRRTPSPTPSRRMDYSRESLSRSAPQESLDGSRASLSRATSPGLPSSSQEPMHSTSEDERRAAQERLSLIAYIVTLL